MILLKMGPASQVSWNRNQQWGKLIAPFACNELKEVTSDQGAGDTKTGVKTIFFCEMNGKKMPLHNSKQLRVFQKAIG